MDRTLEMAHILFMDIVAYSRLPMDQQHEALNHLQEAVRETQEFARAQAQNNDQLIRLPTGDGMALVFLGDVEAPVRCALQLHRILRRWPEIQLRMGIHTGPVYRVEDINAQRNVAGGGINIAQRVMDCGDAGHILLSKAVADVLEQVSTWKTSLCDLGEVEVKHGLRIHLYNLCSQEAGNRKLPQKLQIAQTTAATAQSLSKRKKLSLGAVRILAVDDHPIVRQGIADLVDIQTDMILVGEASNGRDAIQQFRTHHPDVTLMDLQMPEMNGIDALIAIRNEFPDAKIIVLTTYAGDTQILRALKAGAQAYLLKNTLHKELLKTIRAVHTGKKSFSPEVSYQIAEHATDDALTPREVDVLRLIAAGNANKQIADQLSIGESSVKSHVASILSKLGANDRAHAVTLGLRRGIIDLPIP